MTDLRRFPEAVPPVWSSGGSTEAICGPSRNAALKGSKLLLMRLDEQGTVVEVGQLPELDSTHGRLRAVRPGPDGALYVTTSNGEDDKVLRVSPA